MAWARRLQAARTAAGAPRRAGAVGALRTREAAARVTRARRLTGGARRRGGPGGGGWVRE
jgi:hypothetical protein